LCRSGRERPEVGRSANGFVAFLVGLAILRVISLVPILGGLIWFAAPAPAAA
jgi:hypothetical protein